MILKGVNAPLVGGFLLEIQGPALGTQNNRLKTPSRACPHSLTTVSFFKTYLLLVSSTTKNEFCLQIDHIRLKTRQSLLLSLL